jgi:hypothetical protein
MSDHPCQAVIDELSCAKIDRDKPQIFRGEDWCCEQHRKLVLHQGDRP